MASALPRIYWDSCVLLSFIEGDASRLPEIEALFSEADKKEIELTTSTFSVAEVAFAKAERDAAALDATIEEAVDALWRRGGPILLIDFDIVVATAARDLMRQAIVSNPPRSLKGKDAVHLASAVRVGAKELHTYDTGLLKLAGLASVEICAPREQTPILKPQRPDGD